MLVGVSFYPFKLGYGVEPHETVLELQPDAAGRSLPVLGDDDFCDPPRIGLVRVNNCSQFSGFQYRDGSQ